MIPGSSDVLIQAEYDRGGQKGSRLKVDQGGVASSFILLLLSHPSIHPSVYSSISIINLINQEEKRSIFPSVWRRREWERKIMQRPPLLDLLSLFLSLLPIPLSPSSLLPHPTIIQELFFCFYLLATDRQQGLWRPAGMYITQVRWSS